MFSHGSWLLYQAEGINWSVCHTWAADWTHTDLQNGPINNWRCSRQTSADQSPILYVPVASPGFKPKGRGCEERMLRRSQPERACLELQSQWMQLHRDWVPSKKSMKYLALSVKLVNRDFHWKLARSFYRCYDSSALSRQWRRTLSLPMVCPDWLDTYNVLQYVVFIVCVLLTDWMVCNILLLWVSDHYTMHDVTILIDLGCGLHFLLIKYHRAVVGNSCLKFSLWCVKSISLTWRRHRTIPVRLPV